MPQIPALGHGTYRLKDQQVIDSVRNGLQLGYRHIDTAQIYGNEAGVGQAIAGGGVPRSELFVTTKIWADNLGADKLIPSFEESLHKLRLEQVGLTLIHWPSPNGDIQVAEYLAALLEAKAAGLTAQLGGSNFANAHLQQAMEVVGPEQIATHQVEIHPFPQNRKVVEFAQEHGIQLNAHMPAAK